MQEEEEEEEQGKGQGEMEVTGHLAALAEVLGWRSRGKAL